MELGLAGMRILIYFPLQMLHLQSYGMTLSQSGLQMEVEVRERKNELGDSEVVCRATELVLLFRGQPIQSTRHDGLPSHLTG